MKIKSMLTIKGAFVAKVGKFNLVTLGSLVHGSPYVAIKLKEDRIGWFSFKDGECKAYSKKHKLYDDAKALIDEWFENTENYNLAAKTWNSMNTGVSVNLKGDNNGNE
jgi:hypothetical protein